MKNILLLSLITILTSNTTMAQTVKDNIEKLSRNPKTTENAAKADTKIQDKKVIAHPPSGQSSKASSNKGTNPVTGRKKKTICKSPKE